MLDSVQVDGWHQQSPDDLYASPLNSSPTANMSTKGGIVVGNAILGQHENIEGDAAGPAYAFTRLAEDCGSDPSQIWTRWRLLDHFRHFCKPKALPPLELSWADGNDDFDPSNTATIAGYLNDTTGPEIYELRELTCKGALDLLIPETHDLDYRIDIGKESWLIRISTVSTDATHGLPAAVATDIALDSTCAEFQPAEHGADVPDEVVFEGAQHRFGVSVANRDLNWTSQWNSGQQTAYENAPPIERRMQPEHEDTFTLFGLLPANNGDMRRYAIPGSGSGQQYPMCPEVGWDGAHVGIQKHFTPADPKNHTLGFWRDSSDSFSPYLPTAVLASTVPWPVGLKPDGTDTRSDANKAQPVYMKPRVFNYDPTQPAADQWFDLTAKKNPDSDISALVTESPQVDADDRSPGLRIAFNVPHFLGKDTFSGSADNDGVPPELDWRNFIVTVGVLSDQRIRIVKRRQVDGQDIPDNRVRRSVVVRDERFQFWAVLKGTILGVKDDGSGGAIPDRLTVSNEGPGSGNPKYGYITRNDYPAAERYACRLATWAFRPRNPVTISLIRPDLPPAWARIGVVLGTVTDSAPSQTRDYESNTIIRQIRRTWGNAPRLEVSTDILAQPKQVAPSADAGGSVSVANGGTLAQGVARLRTEVGKLQENGQRRIIYPGSTPPAPAAVKQVWIIGGNALATGQEAIQYAATVTPAAVYDPDVDTVYPQGLGNAWLYIDGIRQTDRVLVHHDFLGYTQPLLAGRIMGVIGTEILTYSGTDMTVYLLGLP